MLHRNEELVSLSHVDFQTIFLQVCFSTELPFKSYNFLLTEWSCRPKEKLEQFYFTDTGSTIFDTYMKFSREFEIELIEAPTPIISILVYFNKNKRLELLIT